MRQKQPNPVERGQSLSCQTSTVGVMIPHNITINPRIASTVKG